MKTKIKVLNFVLWLLGLTTERTGLVKAVGKKFELLSYSIQHVDTTRKTTNEIMVAEVENDVNSKIGNFLKNQSAVKYVIDPNREDGLSCVGTVLILKVNK